MPAMEAMAHLYKALLAMPPFSLMDGTSVHVSAYQPPQINDAGEVQCGVDVKLPGGHLEFTLCNTGWGKSFTDAVKPQSRKRSRER